jgi:hypothetical protein
LKSLSLSYSDYRCDYYSRQLTLKAQPACSQKELLSSPPNRQTELHEHQVKPAATMASTRTPKSLTSFLNLPAEMRVEVYTYILPQDSTIDLRDSVACIPPALLSVCRLIRKEAQPIYYGQNTFRGAVGPFRGPPMAYQFPVMYLSTSSEDENSLIGRLSSHPKNVNTMITNLEICWTEEESYFRREASAAIRLISESTVHRGVRRRPQDRITGDMAIRQTVRGSALVHCRQLRMHGVRLDKVKCVAPKAENQDEEASIMVQGFDVGEFNFQKVWKAVMEEVLPGFIKKLE